MEKKIVLIGDIIKSKEIDSSGRKEVQFLLKEVLDDINRRDEGIQSPLTITLGDEFQAVYSHVGSLFSHTWQILAALHPVSIRFSIGLGDITTAINREQAIGMDGSAFHTARDGIEVLKQSGFLYQVTKADDSDGDRVIELVNGSLHLISRQMRTWNKRRLTILHLLDRGTSFKEIAGQLDVSKTAVYKNRTDGSLDVIMNIKNSITALINSQLKS